MPTPDSTGPARSRAARKFPVQRIAREIPVGPGLKAMSVSPCLENNWWWVNTMKNYYGWLPENLAILQVTRPLLEKYQHSP